MPKTNLPSKTQQAARRRAADASRPDASAADKARTEMPWYRRTLATAMFGSLLLWAALPPLAWWPLVWVAAVPWMLLIQREQLLGLRPYTAMWLAGLAFWLAAVHWLRLPHAATSIGWVALSIYLGCYLPLFVGLSRVAVHRLRIPLVVAAPVVWTGLELARGHLLTGFSMGLAGHALYRVPLLIQISDLAGAYAVSFLVILVAACLASTLPDRRKPGRQSRFAWKPLALAVAAVAATIFYGWFRLAEDHARPGPTIALIQGSIDTQLKADPGQNQVIQQHYLRLTQQALRESSAIDLIVWPETMYRGHLLSISPDARPPEGANWTIEQLKQRAEESRQHLWIMSQELGRNLLLGIDTTQFGPGTIAAYNSAVLIDRRGELAGRYDKMHPVIFGEYTPLTDWFPWLLRLTPLTGGIKAGTQLPNMEVRGTRLCPSICFESAVPHLIRRQVQTLRRRGEEPDILVNLTNDGWFYGSSELDMHLACGVFRAVELRKPFLAAANTGFSAWVDANGRIVRQGLRREKGVIVAEVQLDDRTSPYSNYGDIPAGLCLAVCLMLAAVGIVDRYRRQVKS